MRKTSTSNAVAELADALNGPLEAATDAAVEALRAVGFPLRRDVGVVDPSTLTAPQRAIARALAHRAGIDVSRFAMPSQARARRRWIGVDAPGVLEEQVEAAPSSSSRTREPRWALYSRLLDEHDDERIGADLDDEPLRKIEALVEIALGSYDLHSVVATAPLSRLIDAHALELVSYARLIGPELLALFGDRRGQRGRLGDGGPRAINDMHWCDPVVCSVGYLPLVVAGEPFDRALVPLLSFAGVSLARCADVVAWLPEAERDAIATAVFRRSNVHAVPTGVAILERFVLPELAAAMLERFDGGKPDSQTPPSLRAAWHAQLDALAVARPAVAPLVASALSPARRKELALGVARKKSAAPKKPKWAPLPASASIEERLASFEDAIARDLSAPQHTFMRALADLLLDVFGRTFRPMPRRRPASLTPVERRALKVYTDYGVAMHPNLADVGLFDMRAPTRRMLGLEPPELEDALIDVGGERLPVYCAAADAVFCGAQAPVIARAIAALPEAEALFVHIVSMRGTITWAPIKSARRGVTGGVALPDHGPAFVRFLAALAAAIGAPATAFSTKRLAAELEGKLPNASRALVDVVILARAGVRGPMIDTAVALTKSKLGATLVACVDEALA